jgi:cytochrome c
MIPRRLVVPAILTLGLSATGCASALNEIAGKDVGAINRGHRIAGNRCASCHAITADGRSPLDEAPTFGQIQQAYMPGSLSWELEGSSTVGHYDMPATATTAPERSDLVAYIENLRPRAPG